jgi:hypothetical protein
MRGNGNGADNGLMFVDNPNAPVFYADDLFGVDIVGPNMRFMLIERRRNEGGSLIRTPVFEFIIPTRAVGPAIALTLKIAGGELVLPAIGSAAAFLSALH